ncbi:DinB family protein [Streptomyces sp. NPDC005805]|uniref:DinB family protein n=1 Tax=Streptomyces sp. NPDC005805 TaxID=3157068 RepID=UPI0033ED55D5
MPTHVSPESRGDERGALLAFVEAQRGGIRRSLLGLTEEQAASRPSASELSLSGLLKHVTETEHGWLVLARRGVGASYGQGSAEESGGQEEEYGEDDFRLVAGETAAGMLARWDEVAKETEEFVRSTPSLDDTFPLPDAPWYPDGERVSVRWLVLHLIEEIARHAGHADIIRESLDGKGAFDLIALESGEGGGW